MMVYQAAGMAEPPIAIDPMAEQWFAEIHMLRKWENF